MFGFLSMFLLARLTGITLMGAAPSKFQITDSYSWSDLHWVLIGGPLSEPSPDSLLYPKLTGGRLGCSRSGWPRWRYG